MPDKKLPIPEFAAKLKAKYPQYRSLEDTDLVTKITNKYPQYRDAVDLSGIFKKKEDTTLVSEIGGEAGTSVLPSGLTPSKIEVSEFKEPGVGEDTALARRIAKEQKQAVSGTEVRLPAAPKVVAEERAAARAAEPKLSPPTKVKEQQGYLSNVVSALDKGFYKNLVGSPVKALGTLLQFGTAKLTGGTGEGAISNALIKFGDYFNNAIDEIAPQDEEFKNSLSDQFAQALGQVGSMVLTSGIAGAGKGVSMAEQAIPKDVVGKGIAGKLAPAVAATKAAGKEVASELASPAAISAGLVMGQSEFDRAKQAGASDEQAFEAFYKNAAVGSILEKIPVMQFFKRFNNATGGGVVNYIKTKGVAGITGGLEEATTEMLQQVYANKTAKDIYNANQDIFEGLTQSGGIGFGVGFLLNAMGANAKLLRKEGKTAEAQLVDAQVKEFESRAEKGAAAEPQVSPTPPAPTPTQPVETVSKIETEFKPVGEVAPTQEQQLKDIQEGNLATFTYENETQVPEAFKDKISSRGEVNGKPYIKVTVPKSLADYEIGRGVGEVEAAPQVPPTEKTYRVEYFDPESRKMTHQMFANEAEGEAFKKTLTREQTSQGVQSYYEKAPAKGVREEITPQATASEITDVEYSQFIDKGVVSPERLNDIAQKVKNQEKLSEKEQEIFADKTKDINKIIAGEVVTETKPKLPAAPAKPKVENTFTHPESEMSSRGLVNTNDDVNPELPNDKLDAAGRSAAENTDLTQYDRIFVSPNERTIEFANLAKKKEGVTSEPLDLLKTGDVPKREEGEPEVAFDEVKWIDSKQGKDFIGQMEELYKFKQENPDAAFITHSKVNRALKALEKTDGVWNEEVKKEYLRLGEEKTKPELPAAPLEEELPFGEVEPIEYKSEKQITNIKKRALALDITDDPRGEVLQYFLSGGKVNPSALEELFGKERRMGFGKMRVDERRSRTNLTNNKAPGIEALAEKIAGSDRLDRVQEYREAVESALLDHSGTETMAEELVKDYDFEFAEMKQMAELEEMGRAIEEETKNIVSQIPAAQQEEILKVLDAFRDEQGFIDWRRMDAEMKDGFEPLLMELSQPSQKIIENAIRQVQETGRVGRLPIEGVRPETKAGDAARKLAERIRAGKINKEGFRASTGFDLVWDAALEVVASSIEAGASVADAVQDGLKYIKTTDWYKNLTDKKEFENKFTNRLNEEYNAIQVGEPKAVPMGEAPGGRKKVESGIPPTKPPKTPKEGEAEGRKEERRFTERLIESPELLAAVKKGIAPTLEYIRQTNAMTVDEAQQILNVLGEDKAYNVMKDPQTKGAVRVVLGQVLIKRYNQLAKEAATKEDKNLYIGAAVDIAEYVTVSLATEAGQTIQAFSLWDKLTPEAQLVFASRQKAKSARRNIQKVRKDVDNVGEKFNKANEEAVKEILKTEEVSNTVKKDSQEGVQRAKDKAAKARKKRADIINKYKGKGGITLSTGGLTKEGIEFVGEVALTYIEEGIAEVQIIVEKVLADIKNVSGKEPNETVKREVLEIADKKLAKADVDMVKSVKDKKMKIDQIAIQHFTSKERVKKNLAQKFMDQADMSESNAESLAKRFEEAFDRVVNRKKAEILAKNKKRFERIRNAVNQQAAIKAESKTLQDEIIKYSNLGAFSSDDMLDYLANKFKLGQLTKEQAAKIEQLAEKVQVAPEGSPRREATEDLLAYQSKLNGGNWGEVAQGIWYANVLSGYKTHEKNVVSTFINSWVDLGAEIIADPKSAPYIIAGYMEGVKKRGLLEAGRTIATGRSPIHVQKIEIPDVLERVKFKGGGYNPANWFKYVGRAMKAEDVLAFQGLKEARAWQLARREASKLGFNTWSGSGWKKVNELLFNTTERYEIALEQAESEGFKTGTKESKRRIYELMENSRPIDMTEDAYSFAAHGTFNYESDGVLGAFTNAVAKALDSVKIKGLQPGRFIVPFTRVITNVVNNSLDYTPVGIIRAVKGARGFKSFDEYSLTKGTYKPLTPEQKRVVLIKAAIGISFAAIIQNMIENGIVDVSGGGPEDEKKKAQLRESGWQPYSIKIGDKWYSYQLTPLIFALGFIGSYNDAAKYNKEDDKTILKRIQYGLLKFGGMLSDMTWINSAATFLGALNEPKISDQQRELEKALGGMARGFVPFSQMISQATQAYNNIFKVPAKQVDNFWQSLYQDFPIARNSLNDKINALGEPVIKDIDLMVSKEKEDPVWKFLTEKQGWVAPLNKKTVFVFDDKLKQDRPLTDDEYYRLSKKRGELIKEDIKKIIKKGYPVIRDGAVVNVLGEDITPKELNNILSKRIEPLATKRAKAEIFGIEYSEKEDDETKKELTELEREWWGLND